MVDGLGGTFAPTGMKKSEISSSVGVLQSVTMKKNGNKMHVHLPLVDGTVVDRLDGLVGMV